MWGVGHEGHTLADVFSGQSLSPYSHKLWICGNLEFSQQLLQLLWFNFPFIPVIWYILKDAAPRGSHGAKKQTARRHILSQTLNLWRSRIHSAIAPTSLVQLPLHTCHLLTHFWRCGTKAAQWCQEADSPVPQLCDEIFKGLISLE